MATRFMLMLLLLGIAGQALSEAAAAEEKIAQLPAKMSCLAYQTAGFHDFPNNPEDYEAVVFFESKFELHVNQVLMSHLAASSPYDLFLTLRHKDKVVELQCTQLRGAGNSVGMSCSSQPPADLLLLNLENLRFTRTAIGGWTFSGADTQDSGESIYVEYGRCSER